METNKTIMHELILWLSCFITHLVSCLLIPIDPLPAWLFLSKRSARSIVIFIGMQFIALSYITHTVGWWLPYTVSAYSALGYLSTQFAQIIKKSMLNTLLISSIFIITFDVATGLFLGPVFYNQPFIQALFGQIPFTLWHLLTSCMCIICTYFFSLVRYRYSMKRFL